MANKNNRKNERALKVLENLYAGIGCYIRIGFLIIGAVLSIALFLFVAELIFPKAIHIFNYSLSSRVFKELEEAHHYKAVVDFYEHKQELFTSEDENVIYLTRLSDCYIRIGEYEKAEDVLKDIYNLSCFSEETLEKLEKTTYGIDLCKYSAARDLMNLYEKMGDTDGQKNYYSLMKSLLTPQLWEEFKNQDEDSIKSLEDLWEFYDIKISYLESPDKAIGDMKVYVERLCDDLKNGPDFILRCMNMLAKWIIEQDGIVSAYPIISAAVDFAKLPTTESEYGDLSDLCYLAHDIKTSKAFYVKYKNYLSKTTSSEDPLYIENLVRGFKFLEEAMDWKNLFKQVEEGCEGIKSLLSRNLYSMSESQREYFVDLLDKPFGYAIDLLAKHPSDELAELCFNNSIFTKGLLLRSSREMSYKIRNSGDLSLLNKYNELQDYRKELSYRESLGDLGNAIAKGQLKRKINELDKELASACKEYNQDKETATATTKEIRKCLTQNAAAIEFLQTSDNQLLALVLTKNSNISVVPLESVEDIADLNDGGIRQLYSSTELYDRLWNPIKPYLDGVSTIYYSTSSVFNSIAIPTIYTGLRQHLLDIYDFHLFSNMANLIAYTNEIGEQPSNQQIAIWGDIDYGWSPAMTPNTSLISRDIERGDRLQHLIYSKDEVYAIKELSEKNQKTSHLFSDKNATETSFKSRSGNGDNILHISTHGFFTEDKIHRKEYNPMYNSGLFFAGADSTWNRIDTVFVRGKMLDDGILRADEIQYLDFSKCSLAVLSACRTGLGQSKNSEGVYGLQRAFKLAGVDKILMSLWNVDDKCTSDLMTAFYQYFYAGETDEEALRKAQISIRNQYPSPEYWGAFVLLY